MLIHLLIGSALAVPQFQSDIESSLSMACAPACTVCHATNGGGSGTVTHEFGIAMMTRGLTSGSSSSEVSSILDQMTVDGVDSDGDGIIDTDELIAGTDPNPGGVDMCGGTPLETPIYGCATTGAGLSGLGALAGMAGLLLRRKA